MWNRYGMTIAALSLGVVASLVSYDVVQAARSRNYTPREFRSVLRGFGYTVTVNDNPLTDREALAAIRQFQQGYKIQVDGLAGPQTQDLAATLVGILQANLNLVLKPSPALPKSQFYGPLTEAAIRRYQKQAGLQETGIANLALRQRIDKEATAILNNRTPAPSAAPAAPAAPPSPSPTPIPPSAPSSPSLSPVPQTSPSPSPSPVPQTSPSPSLSPVPQTSPNQAPTPSP